MQYVWFAIFMLMFVAYAYAGEWVYQRLNRGKSEYSKALMGLVTTYGEACREHGRNRKSPFGTDSHEEALAASEAEARKAIEEFIG